LASAGVCGRTTLRPGDVARATLPTLGVLRPELECGATRPRNTREIDCPPDMYSIFAAELTIWSSASSAKVPGHELDTGRSRHGGAERDPRESQLGDGRINDAAWDRTPPAVRGSTLYAP